MNKDIMRMSAVFVIALIISIPVYSSSVLASLSNGIAVGSDGLDGNIRYGDNVTLSITANLNGQNVDTSRVHVNERNDAPHIDFSGPPFDSCSSVGNGDYLCNRTIDSADITPDRNRFELNVHLYKNNDKWDSSFQIRGVIDSVGPEIKEFSISPEYSNDVVTLTYDIYDHYFDLNDTPDRCSGIDRIDFSAVGVGVFRNITIGSEPNDCSTEGSVTVPVSDIATADGLVPVTLIAYDSFGHSSSLSSSFIHDTTGPLLDIGSLSVKDSTGYEIDYIGSAPVNSVVLYLKSPSNKP